MKVQRVAPRRPNYRLYVMGEEQVLNILGQAYFLDTKNPDGLSVNVVFMGISSP